MDTPKVLYPGQRTLPTAAAFWILAVLFLMLFFASAAASPLYPVYQVWFGFSAATLTAVFAVYVLVLLVTLLFFGTVSDYLGRLPVILAALVFSVAGCAVFLAAHGVGALYLARSLQGIATGLASGPTGAALMSGRYLMRLYRYLFAFDPETMVVGHIPAHELGGVSTTLPQTD